MGMAFVLLLTVVMVACAPTEHPNTPFRFTNEQRRTWFRPGPVWDGTVTTDRQISREQLYEFADRPVYWLGGHYSGYNAQAPLGELGGQDFSVLFPYGACIFPESGETCFKGSVPYAAEVGIYSNCHMRPEAIPASSRRGKVETVRGGAIVVQEKGGEVKV
jgi:hypothetical protein